MDLTDRLGITPIYMGSTVSRFKGDLVPWDHPHIHGEHAISELDADKLTGSPPYTWGAPTRYDDYVGISVRITPIYMGSTVLLDPHWRDWWDHPHIHGEHIKRSL